MKPTPLMSCILALGLAVSAPTVVFAHVGHGDEFQAEGGINRVQVNAETDSLVGIKVTPIEPATNGSAAVFVPATALVDDNGRQLVFVQYENFYEPVPITTGATKGELVEVTQGLSVGEELVTQGSLSLYAESRKTQTATTSPSPAAASPQPDAPKAQADAQELPNSNDAAGNLVQAGEPTPPSGRVPVGLLAAVGGGAVLLVGAIAVLGGRKKKSPFSNKKGDF
ncbi:cobalt transporter (plasmid) [Phormidium sp. CLA17]|uniref:cobalt transporter n=1 Tax=Leptolyngbya sp. Cla-17 TaxID=2803751 RepID=UPI001491043E|nr:cobalt transporter [Leptolyngbya sp. Cla-17]MBM0745557.1 cobalt transporter [Leptolyngbya sp. Cla-17]MBM0745631.1 cobalt transporter [Leptolyngbya sp. Cla-17]